MILQNIFKFIRKKVFLINLEPFSVSSVFHFFSPSKKFKNQWVHLSKPVFLIVFSLKLFIYIYIIILKIVIAHLML